MLGWWRCWYYRWLWRVRYVIWLEQCSSSWLPELARRRRSIYGGSYIVLMVVDHDQGGSWWWILMPAVHHDCGLWWHPIVMMDTDRGGCWPWTMITTRLLDIQYVSSDTRPLLTIIHQFIYLSLCYKLFILTNTVNTLIFLMLSITSGIYHTCVRPGRGIPLFTLLKLVFCSFSLLMLRVKGRGCHTLLKPYEINCDLWIWAKQIQFYWLIDWSIQPLPQKIIHTMYLQVLAPSQ